MFETFLDVKEQQSSLVIHNDGKKDYFDYLDDKTPGIRHLTARERVRLMGFPDTFKQVVSDSQLSKQSGNSIVVQCMEALYCQMDITKYGITA